MPVTGIWGDPNNIERLKALWADPEQRTADLARELGITRGAVIGKANRLGLGPKAIPDHWQPRSGEDGRSTRQIAKPKAPRDEVKPTKPRKADHPWHVGEGRKAPTPPRSFEQPLDPASTREAAPLLMRDFRGIVGAPGCECRWPLPGQADREGWMEETLFCGAPVAVIPARGGATERFAPYCRTHLERSVNHAGMAKVRKSEKSRPQRSKSTRRAGVFDVGTRSHFH